MAKPKSRYFTFLLYPESIPEDWLLRLELLGVPIAVSPLHDRDKSDVAGQAFKKSHYHLIYIAKNPVTSDSVRRKVQGQLGAQSISMVQVIKTSVENAYLYLTHESKDALAKKKHVYPKSELIFLNNFDIDRYISLSVEDKDKIYCQICEVITIFEIANILELYRFVVHHGEEYGLPDMSVVNNVIKGQTGLIRLYFDAAYQRRVGGYCEVVKTADGKLKKVFVPPSPPDLKK